MDWRPVQGVPCLSPNGRCDGLQLQPITFLAEDIIARHGCSMQMVRRETNVCWFVFDEDGTVASLCAERDSHYNDGITVWGSVRMIEGLQAPLVYVNGAHNIRVHPSIQQVCDQFSCSRTLSIQSRGQKLLMLLSIYGEYVNGSKWANDLNMAQYATWTRFFHQHPAANE